MIVDVHAHYGPSESLRQAVKVGAGRGLAMGQDSRDSAAVTWGGEILNSAPKAEFFDLERFPQLKFLLAHAGGFMPYTSGRFERDYHIQDSAPGKISKPPSEYVRLLYFDTIAHNPMALAYLIDAERVLLGSDCPYDIGDPEPVASPRATRVVAQRFDLIAGTNACKLLGSDISQTTPFTRRQPCDL